MHDYVQASTIYATQLFALAAGDGDPRVDARHPGGHDWLNTFIEYLPEVCLPRGHEHPPRETLARLIDLCTGGNDGQLLDQLDGLMILASRGEMCCRSMASHKVRPSGTCCKFSDIAMAGGCVWSAWPTPNLSASCKQKVRDAGGIE